MSSTIIYDRSVVRIAGSFFGHGVEDQFMLLEVSGSSNTYDFSGKRARDSRLTMFGSYSDLMAYFISEGYYAGGGMTYWRVKGKSGELSWKNWINKMTRMLNSATQFDPTNETAVEIGKTSYYLSSRSNKQLNFKELIEHLYQQSLNLNNDVGVLPSYSHLVRLS